MAARNPDLPEIDPVAQAGLVTRSVRTSMRDGAPTRVVVAQRTYRATREELWDALTNPQRLPRWFLPVHGDLQVGGRYQLEGNASGLVESCDPPSHFAVTWEFGGGVSWLEVSLVEEAGAARLEVAHEAPVDPEFWHQFGPGAAGVGWDLGLLGLDLHLSTGQGRSADADTWSTSPDGVAFVRAAAGDWAQAAVADGDSQPEAEAAAERTVGFYTTPAL